MESALRIAISNANNFNTQVINIRLLHLQPHTTKQFLLEQNQKSIEYGSGMTVGSTSTDLAKETSL